MIIKAFYGLAKIMAMLAGILIVIIAGLILAEITYRNVWGKSLDFPWEYSAYLMSAAAMLAAPNTLTADGHIRVSIMQSLRPGFQKVVDIFVAACALLVSSTLAYALCMLAYRSYSRGSTSPTINAVPLAIPQSVMAFGAVLLAVQLLLIFTGVVFGKPMSDIIVKDNSVGGE